MSTLKLLLQVFLLFRDDPLVASKGINPSLDFDMPFSSFQSMARLLGADDRTMIAESSWGLSSFRATLERVELLP
ncbi:hypothetical protein KP509_27G018400 [Ceratopteris richardii]|uniref:Uncharacterized protein n=1 Tax=Ceratopteris richardii TaxID=49495 RepID=A0A8T2RFT8_CERRI|nr:hypothetical protein KP509_27G018400 [Ceratopteris richardii]